MQKAKQFLKYPLGLFFIAAGIGHFVMAEFFLAIMPPYIPWHHFFVYLSGVAEIALGVALLIPATTRLAAWGLIALLIAVFPANIHMALNPELFADFGTPTALWVRLPLQGVLIAWAFWYTRPGDREATESQPATR
jgi:uncharacterized membrane protein